MSGRSIRGWAGVSQCVAGRVIAPTSVNQAQRMLDQDGGVEFLGRGLGRSYGDCALNGDGFTIDCRFLDRLLAFDAETGVLECEAGVSMADINRVFSPAGWMLPVVPGTRWVTIGGAIANDIHGKNHRQQGSFGSQLISLKLARSNGELLDCGASNNPALFAATIGGLGLTGLIVSAKLQLRPLSSLLMRLKRIRFNSLESLFSLYEEHTDAWEYHNAWLDPSAGCRRGYFIAANHLDEPGNRHWPRRHAGNLSLLANSPSDLPGRLTMSLANAWHRTVLRSGTFDTSMESVLYPLDRLPGFNALSGRRGFFQHQCVLPGPNPIAALHELLNVLDRSGQQATLAVGKWFGDDGSPGILSFPMAGFSLALDIRNRGASTLALLERLDERVAANCGRLYPAKDATGSPALFSAGYPGLGRFAEHIDPNFTSDFWRRMERCA